MTPTLKFPFLSVCILLGLLSTATQFGFAQNAAAAQANPLKFGNNFFVTGDYIVAGTVGMNKSFQTINGTSYTVGTITVPDGNPGIQGATQVPKGAQVVAALLYWQTVEMTGAAAGGPGSGQNGFFRPLLYKNSGGPAAPGYAFSGVNVGSTTAVTWSGGTCAGTSSNKITRTYRADVGGGLPIDANGNQLANGSFEVRLPSVGTPATPLTFGATLFIIYRIPTGARGPNVPLNAIVFFDGAADPGATTGSVTQLLNGFYDADAEYSPISRLTYIGGNGSPGRTETLSLSSTGPLGANAPVRLPSLYPKLPAFPGYYSSSYGWDNPTWTFSGPNNPIQSDAFSATTQLVPSGMSAGCISTAAVIFSTTVNNPNHDGILYSWKTNQGYCDVSMNPSCSGLGDPAWVDLRGAGHNQKDVFLQYDYMCSSVTSGICDSNIAKDNLSEVAAASGGTTTYTGTITHALQPGTLVGIAGFTKPANEGQFTVVSNSSTTLVVNNPNGVAETHPGVATYAIPGDQNYSFDPRLATDPFSGQTAVDKVVASYANENGSSSSHTPIVVHATAVNAIAENQTSISCPSSDLTCVFPNEPGTVGFRAGLISIKNTYIEPSAGLIGCDPSTDVNPCVPVFQHGKKDSYHYALFSHGSGTPSLFLSDGSIQSVKQTANTVTFTTKSAHGISQIVAQANYATATDTTCKFGRVTVILAITNTNLNGTFCVLSSPAPTATTFSISVGGSATNFTYTAMTDPNMAVANGQVTSVSGLSDVGGDDSIISLGYGGWGPPTNPFADGNQWQDKAGTFMHELGHTMFLSHGGTFYNNYKPSAMPPVIDYTPTYEVNCKPNLQSNMSYLFQFDLLQVPGVTNPDGTPLMVVDYSEESLPTLTESSMQATGVLSGAFYATTSWFEPLSIAGSGPLMSTHCDFTPLLGTDPPTVAISQKPVSLFGSAANQDINFNGTTTDVMDGHDEWDGTAALGAVGPAPGIDLQQVSALGTLSAVGPGGSQGGLKPGGGGLKPGGGGLKPGGGGLKPGGGAEMTHEQACSYPRSPQNLTILQEEASPRYIDLSWFGPSVCQPVNYKVYRSVAGGTFTVLATLSGSQTTYQDTTATCNLSGYRYEVTAVENNAGTLLESAPSNIVPAIGQAPLTGCYAPVNVAVEPNGVQGDIVPVTWTLTDDYYITPGTGWQNAAAGNPVTNLKASSLVANGPALSTCASGGATTILSKGTPQSGVSMFANTNPSTGLFTFNWDTDPFCAGSYNLQLSLDSGQPVPLSSSLQLSIDINDHDNPHVTTLALPNGTVAVAYNPPQLTEDGGTAPFTWTVTNLPPGISQSAMGSPNLSGTTCVAGTYNSVTATVTDSAKPPNSGSQGFTLLINQGSTTTGVISSANPSVFQQSVTFTVTVASAPPSSCTPTGTVTLYDGPAQIGTMSLTNGTATFALPLAQYNPSVGVHSITASYGGDSNFTSSSSGALQQTVNPAPTQIVFNSLTPSTVFVGQPITVFYTFSVVAPGAGSPIAPTGNISVTANGSPTSDNSSCVAKPTLGGGMCTLSTVPTAPGTVTFTINYPGDGNFVMSGANSGYTVYQLVFTVQPSNTGVGLSITPAVQVTAEDSTGATLMTFGGGITVGKGSGPGTLSGTFTQPAMSGVATFNDLSINQIANGYTLTASPAGGVPDATSNAFNITLVTQLQPTTPPSARCCAAMAYDSVNMSTLLFGGTQTLDNINYSIMNDTWQLKNGQWTQLSPGTSPPPRSGAAMVYDPAHNNIVLFGGTTGSSDLNDTWIWNGSTWTLANPATSPPGRRFDSQGMAYDPNTQTVVMFGGIDYTSNVFYNDTWVWNGTTWAQMSPTSSPSARRTVLATDPSGNVMLFGGGGASGALADTWVWDGTKWNQQSPATSPAARDLHNMAFNPNVSVVVLFAGAGGFNDVWTWDGATWTQVTPAAAAPQRYAFGMDYDGAANAIFVFGGFTNNGPAINDTWEFTVAQ